MVILFFLSLELRGMLKSYLRSTKVTFFWIQSVFVFFFCTRVRGFIEIYLFHIHEKQHM